MPKTTKKKETEIKQNKERGGLLTTDGKREIWQGCQLLEISPPPEMHGECACRWPNLQRKRGDRRESGTEDAPWVVS